MKFNTGNGLDVPNITQLEMTDADIALAEQAARKLGYTQTAYTSTSQLWGLYCLPDHAHHKHGVFIKTAELGLLFVADLEDLQFHDLAEQERKAFTEQNRAERVRMCGGKAVAS